MRHALRFHWSLSQVGDQFRRSQATEKHAGVISIAEQIRACRCAEEAEIDSMLMAIGFGRPDPMILSVTIGQQTEKIRFMVACRSGLTSPVFFVQQINTLSTLVQGRVHVNMVCGHTPRELGYYGDFLSHDERYDRTDEFLQICQAFWSNQGEVNFTGKYYRIEKGRIETPFLSKVAARPTIYLGGNSEMARRLAIKYADCLWRFPDRPEQLNAEIGPVLEAGKRAGLLVSLIARPTRLEALEAAATLIASFGPPAHKVQEDFASRSDSIGFRSAYAMSQREELWLTHCLWTGAVPYLGAPAVALVGSFDEVADCFLEYGDCGISEFLLMGWPDVQEMKYFRDGVLPLVRRREAAYQTLPWPSDSAAGVARN
jgi:alkanesulfonate monooxygenase